MPLAASVAAAGATDRVTGADAGGSRWAASTKLHITAWAAATRVDLSLLPPQVTCVGHKAACKEVRAMMC